jgi:tetratricopeptide (TPR) repeat protein
MAINRLEQLLAMAEKNPRDPFVLYGIGMEQKKVGKFDVAVDYFDKTLAVDPGYCYAYYQKGQTQEAAGQSDAARQSYQAGIAAAKAKGDGHAAGEIAAALDLLGE